MVYDIEGTRLGANEKAKSWELMSNARLEADRRLKTRNAGECRERNGRSEVMEMSELLCGTQCMQWCSPDTFVTGIVSKQVGVCLLTSRTHRKVCLILLYAHSIYQIT